MTESAASPAGSRKLIQFGAGNIGRSFIGQLFSRGGFEVVFIDVDSQLVNGLNKKHSYNVVVKQNDAPDEIIEVSGVRAIHGTDTSAVSGEIASCDLVATSVGMKALGLVVPVIASGIRKRIEAGSPPLDLIIAENMHDGAAYLRTELGKALPEVSDLDRHIGLVETSIGKMVPIMTDQDRAADPLQVFAEKYNTLIVDRTGFLNRIPAIDGLLPVENIRAYVDRKLFIHNLGHAATAYLGFARFPESRFVYEVLADDEVKGAVTRCMQEAAQALLREYPDQWARADLDDHIQDLLFRFRNRALRDTIHRVGRDLYRKLAKTDRLVGAMLLAAKHGLPFETIAKATAAGLGFQARDEHGDLFPSDLRFIEEELPRGSAHIIERICGLSSTVETERIVTKELRRTFEAVGIGA